MDHRHGRHSEWRGTLSSEEVRDNLRASASAYGSANRCHGCSKNCSVEHAMSCKAGGLILFRHKAVAGEWHRLSAQAVTPASVSPWAMSIAAAVVAHSVNSSSNSETTVSISAILLSVTFGTCMSLHHGQRNDAVRVGVRS